MAMEDTDQDGWMPKPTPKPTPKPKANAKPYDFLCDTVHLVYITLAADPSNLMSHTNPGNQTIVEPLVATSVMDMTHDLKKYMQQKREKDNIIGCGYGDATCITQRTA